MNDKKQVNLSYLDECFSLDEEKGVLYWKNRPLKHFRTKQLYLAWNARFANKEAGSNHKSKGYKYIVINHKRYLAHRLIWAILYRVDIPDCEIDHIDGNGLNNKPNNLRLVIHSDNMQNVGIRKNNRSGVTGVGWCEKLNKWHSRIFVKGKGIHLGYFERKEDAIKARLDAEANYHPFSARGFKYAV